MLNRSKAFSYFFIILGTGQILISLGQILIKETNLATYTSLAVGIVVIYWGISRIKKKE